MDETGIYVQGFIEDSTRTSQLFYLYYNNVVDVIENLSFGDFATTSPGTQPLPESMWKCMLHYITICVYICIFIMLLLSKLITEFI